MRRARGFQKDYFRQPAPTIPVHQFHNRFQQLSGSVGQQPLFDRFLAGRRVSLAGQNRRDGHGRPAFPGGQGHRLSIDGLPHEPGRPDRHSISPSASCRASRFHTFSPAVVLRLCVARTRQSASVPRRVAG